MNKLTIALIATVFNGAMAASGFAGETKNCACETAPLAGNSTIGSILQSSGEVLFTSAAGYSEAKSGSNLVVGSQVSVGNGASAKISVGSSCKLKVPANSIATILQPQGAGSRICVKVASVLGSDSTAVQEGVSTQQGNTIGGPSLILGGATITAVTGITLIGIGDEPASP